MIPYENLQALNAPFLHSLKRRACEVIDSGWYVLGSQVQAFESAFATYCQAPYCVGLASGLDALVLALEALAIPKGSEVLVPSNTYIASILSILRADLTPVFVEPDPFTYNITAEGLQAALTPQTKALLVVHLYGRPCPMLSIMDFANQHRLAVVEDCAQAHGALVQGQPVGTFGDIGAFSFYPTKNLGGFGDGGAIVTSSLHHYETIRKLRNYGSEQRYHNDLIGYNSRLDELQAALLLEKLPHLDAINQHKNKLAALYFSRLANSAFSLPQPADSLDYHVFHIFNILHPKRDALREYLKQNHILTDIHYPIPPHHQRALANLFSTHCYPVSERIHSQTLSLPLSYCHTAEDIHRVCDVLLAWNG